jgi:aminoglycoside phosphotransferase (APT) family kinase protein
LDDPSVMPARLAAFLAANEPDATDIQVTSYEVMTGGYSRLLARADVTWRRGGAVEQTSFVLRGDPPPDRSLIHTDRAYEWAVLKAVEGRVRIAQGQYFDSTGEHLGTKAIVLEHSTAESFLPHTARRGDDLGELPLRLADAAASLHAIPIDDLPAEVERPKSWDDYIGRRIGEWRQTALDHVEAEPFLRYLAAWLDAHRPPEVPLSLIHGDFQCANLLVDEDDEIVILDWELAQVGDPREDLGYFKAVAQAAPPDLIDVDPEAFCARYRELTGLSEEQVNPAVISYFLILGVIGTVRRLLEGGAAYARGENHLLASLFNMNSVQFGHMMWMQASIGLEAAFAAPPRSGSTAGPSAGSTGTATGA